MYSATTAASVTTAAAAVHPEEDGTGSAAVAAVGTASAAAAAVDAVGSPAEAEEVGLAFFVLDLCGAELCPSSLAMLRSCEVCPSSFGEDALDFLAVRWLCGDFAFGCVVPPQKVQLLHLQNLQWVSAASSLQKEAHVS
jgi:hypothetical protein